ncbi:MULTISPECIES: hypothetical protein [unclassified Coleofasciculus]|uniref:hypothetical protein n=1 Tax=unclassified Coleofasciculus TaxID=2692782 RepID=UPI00187E37FE|nr:MULTISPECIES: hypothetical protein [unclassified Coleofasciculus]MBE9126616.1 hypothetical protein [Coleofasciculus sp. LEGE 07081]MBE9148868.1 hypothetical protein [Coleofasciculus sp. LEGE 07092]
MAGTIQRQPNPAIPQIVDQILNTGQLSRQEHLQLVTTILSDYNVTDEERSHINRVFDELQVGHLKFIE